METIKIRIPFNYGEYYLPTKRHKIEELRGLATCHIAEVKELEETEFPIAIKVTDYGKWNPTTLNNKMVSIELRCYKGKLYKALTIRSGINMGEFLPIESLSGLLTPKIHEPYYYELHYNPDKPFVKGVSVITGDEKSECIQLIYKKAQGYIIFDGKIWEASKMPYYSVTNIGCDHVYFSINWAEDTIDYRDYLATQRDIALSHAREIAKTNRNDKEENAFAAGKEPKNIEILMPECYTLKRNLESSKLKGYFYDDEKDSFIKEYGPVTSHAEKWLIRFIYGYKQCIAVIYTQMEFTTTNERSVWYVVGQLLEDVRNLQFNDIKEIYSIDQDMDVLKWLNDYRKKISKL